MQLENSNLSNKRMKYECKKCPQAKKLDLILYVQDVKSLNYFCLENKTLAETGKRRWMGNFQSTGVHLHHYNLFHLGKMPILSLICKNRNMFNIYNICSERENVSKPKRFLPFLVQQWSFEFSISPQHYKLSAIHSLLAAPTNHSFIPDLSKPSCYMGSFS